MGNMNISYIQYELEGDQFGVWSVFGLDPVTSDFYVSYCYFETFDKISA